MIHSIEVRNFRCFQHLLIEGCRRFNVLVGDNGAGKTALLEAMFMTLASNPDVAVRLRQQRGLEGSFAGTTRNVEEALWKDLFFQSDWSRTIQVELRGDGPEARSVAVFRGLTQQTIPLEAVSSGLRSLPIIFQWRDAEGRERARSPRLTAQGFEVTGVDEDLPDFFYFPSNHTTSSNENAGRFSDLSRANRSQQFVKLFTDEYPWIENLNIEVLGGSPVIYATLRDTHAKLPLAYVSGGINRILGVMLAVGARERGVVLVDEIENGIYYKHHVAMWRALLTLARGYEAQLFVTTHNEEWLEALFDAAGPDVADIALWRIERSDKGPVLRQFSGRQSSAAVKAGEVR